MLQVLSGVVNLIHSCWYGAMVWICAANSVHNTGMFSFLLRSAYTELRPLLPLTPPTTSE